MTVNPVALFLVVLIALGVLSHNGTITVAAAVLLLIQQTWLAKYLPLVDRYALQWGIILLTIGVLSPLISGRALLPTRWQDYVNWKMTLAMVTGVAVAWIAGRGIPLMSGQPVLVTGLLTGTILGVAFLGGVPVGPLIAAGLLSFLIGNKT